MIILVDGDACPVREIIVKVAKEVSAPVKMFMDYSHEWEDEYSEVILVDTGKDSVDMAIINRMEEGDVVVTQDYGLASLCILKGYAINQNGRLYTKDNIDRLLAERFLSQNLRKQKVKLKQMKKRTEEDDVRFETAFRRLLRSILYGLS